MQAWCTLNMMVPRGSVRNRSRRECNMAVNDLPRLLTSSNQLFLQSTHDASYATTVFADYND
jgi:hypothetical protein